MGKEKNKDIIKGLDETLAADLEKVREAAKAPKGSEELLQRLLAAEEDAKKTREELAAKEAEAKQNARMIVKAQERIDKITLANTELQRTLRDIENSKEIKEFYTFFVESIKSRPQIMATVLQAAKDGPKTDILDPSKTQDLSDSISMFLAYVVDAMRSNNEWGKKEAILQGIAEIATRNLSRVLDSVKNYLTEEDKMQLEQRIKKSEEAERSIREAEKAQHKGEKIDKSKLEKPESLGSIVAGYVPNVNKTYRADELFVVGGLLGAERLKEYAVITDKQKKVEFVQATINAAIEQYRKNRDKDAEQKIAEEHSKLEEIKAACAAAEKKAAEESNKLKQAEEACEAVKKELSDYVSADKARLLQIWQAIPRDVDTEGIENPLMKAWLDDPKGETESVAFENILVALKKAMDQRDNYKHRAITAEESAKQAHELLGNLDEQVVGNRRYIAELEKTVSEQAEKQKQIEEEKEKLQTDANTDREQLNEKIKKLESCEGFKFTDFVPKKEYIETVAKKDEEILALKKISEGHISKDTHDAEVKAKEDEVRAEYTPVITNKDKQIADLKSKMSELEKALTEKGTESSAIAKELNDTRQMLEEANVRVVYDSSVHMPKDAHTAEIKAVHEQYKPVVEAKEDLEKKADQQEAALAEKSKALGEMQQKLEAAEKAKAELEKNAKQQDAVIAEKEKLLGEMQQNLGSGSKNKLELEKKTAELQSDYTSAVVELSDVKGKLLELQAELEAKAKLEKELAEHKSELESLKLGLENASKITPYNPEKHVLVEKYAADIKQKDEQIAAKQKELEELASAKAAVEQEFAKAKKDYIAGGQLALDEHKLALEEIRKVSKERIAGLEKAMNDSIETLRADIPKLSGEARAADQAVDALLKASAEAASAKIIAAEQLADSIILNTLGQEEHDKYVKQAFATNEERAGWLKETVKRIYVSKADYDAKVEYAKGIQEQLDAAGKKLEETVAKSAQALEAAEKKYSQSLEQIKGEKAESENKADAAQEMLSAVLGSPDALKEYMAITGKDKQKAWLKDALSKLYTSSEEYAALEKKFEWARGEVISLNRQLSLTQEESQPPQPHAPPVGKAVLESLRNDVSKMAEELQRLKQSDEAAKKDYAVIQEYSGIINELFAALGLKKAGPEKPI